MVKVSRSRPYRGLGKKKSDTTDGKKNKKAKVTGYRFRRRIGSFLGQPRPHGLRGRSTRGARTRVCARKRYVSEHPVATRRGSASEENRALQGRLGKNRS